MASVDVDVDVDLADENEVTKFMNVFNLNPDDIIVITDDGKNSRTVTTKERTAEIIDNEIKKNKYSCEIGQQLFDDLDQDLIQINKLSITVGKTRVFPVFTYDYETIKTPIYNMEMDDKISIILTKKWPSILLNRSRCERHKINAHN